MGAKVSAKEFALVLRGWAEERRKLRVVLKNPTVSFGVFCEAYGATEDGEFSITVGESSMIGVSLVGCVLGFLDAPPESEPVLGKSVESGLVAVRPDFELAIMLLA